MTVTRPPSDRILSVFHVHIKEECVDAFLSAVKAIFPKTAREEGVLRYEFLQSREDPTRFTFVDLFRDQDALDSHAGTEHLRRFMEAIADFHRAPYGGEYHFVREIFDRTGGTA